ncbi:unnamed protein product [marine sediment metagenome]|uniref:histidine kinase n=1 Tax=marine sediment metagenome TaxID=412755 RepID=X1AUA0_9ZZZZ
MNTKVINFQKKPYILSIFRDITDLKKAEEIISKEVERLKEIDEIKNEFIIRASHELKTPLIPIYSLTDLILKLYNDKLDPKVLEFINYIHEGGARLLDLVADLIEISKVSSRDVNIKLEVVDLVELIQECIENYSVLALEKDIYLKVFNGVFNS